MIIGSTLHRLSGRDAITLVDRVALLEEKQRGPSQQIVGLAAPHTAAGTTLECEVTVEAVRHRVHATDVNTPFFNPAQKTAPIA